MPLPGVANLGRNLLFCLRRQTDAGVRRGKIFLDGVVDLDQLRAESPAVPAEDFVVLRILTLQNRRKSQLRKLQNRVFSVFSVSKRHFLIANRRSVSRVFP